MTKKLNEIQKLIDDEIEAIEGYDKSLEIFKGTSYESKLKEIRDEEITHKKELEEIYNKLENELFGIKE